MGTWSLSTVVALGLAVLGLAPAAASASVSANRGRTCREAFRIPPYLTHVTDTAIRVNMIPEDSIDLRVSLALPHQTYGTLAQVTETGATADTRTHLVAAPNATFTGLTAGTAYKYMTECRPSAGSPWQVVNKATFRTLKTDAAATVKVAFVGDDHTTIGWQRENCVDPALGISIKDRRQAVRSVVMNQTRRNIRSSGADFLINMGDNAMVDAGTAANCLYTREDGTTVLITASGANDAAEQLARWEVMMYAWQPVFEFLPAFILMGNHEGIFGYTTPNVTQALSDSALTAMQSTLGNYNDAYPVAALTDFDGDTVAAESKNEGLYYEWASGSFRFFAIDNQRYTADTGPAGAVPAAQFAGFVARTADQPAAVHPNTPSGNVAYDGTDSYEDNMTLGGEQTGWLIAQAAAKTEAFGGIFSHKTTGGITQNGQDYWYARGLISTNDDDGDGRREVSESWDSDGDGDVADEKYIHDLMVANNIQVRILGHDHQHTICRTPSMVDFIEVGQPGCEAAGSTVDGGCTNDWNTTVAARIASGDTVNADAEEFTAIYRDIYDCNEDGNPDYDNSALNSSFGSPPSSEGFGRPNGTLNKGFGLLTITGNTSMMWQWIRTDPFDQAANNDTVVDYGPILP